MTAELSNREVSRLFLARRMRLLAVRWWGMAAVALAVAAFFAVTMQGWNPLLLLACAAPFVPWAMYARKIVRDWRCPVCEKRLTASPIAGFRYWRAAPTCEHCTRQLAG